LWYSINFLELKDLKDYANRDLIMDSFEKKFESPVGMLVYMKERIQALDGTSSAMLVLVPNLPGLVTTAVTYTPCMNAGKKKKRKASSEDSSSEEKETKKLKVANENARKMMKSGLDNMGFKTPADFGAMEWMTFKTNHPEVSTTSTMYTCNKMLVITSVVCLQQH